MKRFCTMILAVFTVCSAATAQDVTEGAEIFARHCATCHGADAAGGGPMAPALIVQPSDLTGLAAGNEGVFPMTRVVMRIDGRDPLVSHGSSMPVYGDFFLGEEIALKTESGQPILTAPAVVDLVAYLQRLQR